MSQRPTNNRQMSKLKELILVIVFFGLSYLFFSLSIDKGNLWYYLLTLIFFVYFLKFGLKLLGNIFHGLINR